MPEVFASFEPVAATPYLWPFDGRWSSADSALLLLGFQRGIVEHLGAKAALARAIDLADAARDAGIAVIATRRGYAETDAMAARRRVLGDAVPAVRSPEWEFSEGLVADTDQIFDHGGDNAFYGTRLEASLRQRGISNLLIAGLPTEGLVHATQRAANDMGFECLAVADACQGTDAARHTAQLRITTFGNGLFGAVADTAAIRSALLSTPKAST